MEKPLISVVIPAFNEEKYLPQCLESLKQTYKNFETIVVDNNSTDKTGEIARKFGARVVFEQRQGIAYAREAGFKAAKGEIIARTDADGLPPPNWLAKIQDLFARNPGAIGVTGPTIFFDGSPLLNALSEKIIILWLKLGRILMGHYQFNGHNFAILKKVVRKIKKVSFDQSIHEDMDLACRAAHFGKIIFAPDLAVSASARRIKKRPFFTFLDYSLKATRSLFLHHPHLSRHKIG